MSRHFDGTNDNVSFGSDASVDQYTSQTVMFWVFSPGWQTGIIAGKCANIAASGWNVLVDVTPDYLVFMRSWSTASGFWATPNSSIANDTRYHVAVTYSASATTNDPTIYLDGVAQSLTEVQAPTGTLVSDASQTLRLGEDTGGTNDQACDVLAFLYHNEILTAADVNRARWWGRPRGGLQVYHPFFTDKLTNEGAATANGTASGSTVTAAFCPPVQRPGSAMMGMGVGF